MVESPPNACAPAEPAELADPPRWSQRLRACALNPQLREYTRQVVSPANLVERVRKYFREQEPQTIELLFGDDGWEVDHIVPHATAGDAAHTLENFVLMEPSTNHYFRDDVRLQDKKRAYVGAQVYDFAVSSVKHNQKRPRLV